MRTLILSGLLAACTTNHTPDMPGPHQPGTMTYWYLDGAAPKVDVLFVIDSSAAMASHEAQIQQTLQLVASTAETRLRGPRANLHVGVLTGDTSTGGAMRHIDLVDGPYMIDRFTPSVDQRNYHSEFATTMMSLTAVGTAGADRVQPLEAIRTALDHNAQNAGFVRDDAALAIVVLAAEDDASPGDPADYRAFVQSLKTDANDAMIAVAAPDGSTRLSAFAAGKIAPLDSQGIVDFVFQNACVPDATGEGSPVTCLYGELLDSDTALPGVQPSCTVSDSGGTYPACGADGATPCWRVASDAGNCGSDLEFTIDRGALDPPALINYVTVECVTP
ncbi:MAG TPA: hypothetical protein VFQ65_31785 [Kofleriaceae bacterium]|nr:hypothetical protein [Kofleriaceae bacterium]